MTEPRRRPFDHRDSPWYYRLNDDGYVTVTSSNHGGFKNGWTAVPCDPILLDAIYDVGYEDGESNAEQDGRDDA